MSKSNSFLKLDDALATADAQLFPTDWDGQRIGAGDGALNHGRLGDARRRVDVEATPNEFSGAIDACLGNLRHSCHQALSEMEALQSENISLRAELAGQHGQDLHDSQWAIPRPPDLFADGSAVAPPGVLMSPRQQFSSNNINGDAARVHQKLAPIIRDQDGIGIQKTGFTFDGQDLPDSFQFKPASPEASAPCYDDPESSPQFQVDMASTMNSLAAMRIGMISKSDQIGEMCMGNETSTGFMGIARHVSNLHRNASTSFLGFDSYNSADPIALQIARSATFKFFTTFAIILNTVSIAVDADFNTKSKFKSMQSDQHTDNNNTHLEAVEWTFTIWFTIEIMIRCCAEKRDFFNGPEYRWNLFDSFLVVNSYLQSAIPKHANLSFIRILRVFRLTRVIKVIKNVPGLSSLRTMVFSIINSFVNLLWAMLVLFLVVFMFGMIFLNGVMTYFDNATTAEEIENAIKMEVHFGSLYETMVSLVCSVTGGNDYMQYAEFLRMCEPTEVYFIIFMFYILFTVVGLLNVVTGIFVDSAVCTRTEDEVIEQWKSEQRNTVETLRSVFKAGDVDNSGTMSLHEFRNHLMNPWVRAYFSGLEIDPSDAVSIFTLIASEGCDEVDIDEFVAGMIKLKGHAKSVDVLTLMYDSANQTVQLNNFMQYVEMRLEQMLPNGARSLPRKDLPATIGSLAQKSRASLRVGRSSVGSGSEDGAEQSSSDGIAIPSTIGQTSSAE